MTPNPLIEEIHATRARLLAESGGTLAGLVERLRREEQVSGWTILLRPPRKTTTAGDDERCESPAAG